MAIHDFSHSLPMLLYRALAAVLPRFRRVFAGAGLTEQQWRVLRVLWEREDITLGELAGLTLIPAPSLVGVVDRLSANGLVERQRVAHDRRAVHVRATAAGRALEERLMPAVAAVYAELRGSLDVATWRALEDGLARLAETGDPVVEAATGTLAPATPVRARHTVRTPSNPRNAGRRARPARKPA